MSFNPQLDELLSRVAQQHGSLEEFLGGIFSFFERRTDLFHVMQNKEERMGFPPGVAENMVVEQFRKYQELYQKRTGNKVPEGVECHRAGPAKTTSSSSTAAAAKSKKKSSTSDAPAASAVAKKTAAPSASSPESASTTSSSESTAVPSPADSSTLAADMRHISTWNGAVTDEYRWSQSLNEVTLEIVVGCSKSNPVKSSELDVSVKRKELCVKCRGRVVLEGDWHMDVEPVESLWNLEERERLVLSLEKVKKTWWECVFRGGPKIDTTKVESVKRIEDYDEGTQGTIRKIVFDQNQKHQGKPSSDQIRTAELMKGAWNAEGSPFRGTEFDPSLLNLTNPLPQDLLAKN